jgi:hypothetical protein
MTTPIFVWCPFAGIICTRCETAVVAEGKNSLVQRLGEHQGSKRHQKHECAVFDKPQRNGIVESAKKYLEAIARTVVAPVSQENLRHELGTYLAKPSDFFFCNDCSKFSSKKKHHSIPAHRSLMEKRQGLCPLLISDTSCVIPVDYDPSNRDNYCQFFRNILAAVDVQDGSRMIGSEEREGRADLARRLLRHEDSEDWAQPQAKKAKLLDKATIGKDDFAKYAPSQNLVECLDNVPKALRDVMANTTALAGLGHDDATARFTAQLEMYTASGSSSTWIMDWLFNLGFTHLASTMFENSYPRLASFMIAAQAGAFSDKRWQAAVTPVMELWIESGGDLLGKVNPSLLQRVMQVGNYDQPATASSIKDILSHVGDAILDRTGHNDDEDHMDNVVADFLASDGADLISKITKASGKDTSGPSRKGLRPLSFGSRGRYRKLIAKYIVFVGRCSESNVSINKFWAEDVRPALESYYELAQQLEARGETVPSNHAVAVEAVKAVNWLILATCEIGKDQTYADQVCYQRSLPGFFARCFAVDGVNNADGGSIFTTNGPNALTNAAAGLMYSIRLATVIGMIHAAESGNVELQHTLPSPRVAVESVAVKDLANVIRLSRNCDQRVRTGRIKAVISKSNPDFFSCGLLYHYHRMSRRRRWRSESDS